MSASQKAKNKISATKRGGGTYVPLCHRVVRSEQFGKLSPRATKLLTDLLSQYSGSNNGDLSVAMGLMKARGWSSHSGLSNATSELLKAGFIVLAKAQQRPKPNLYALTFFAIDDCGGKHDLVTTETPTDEWRQGQSPVDIQAAQKRNEMARRKKKINELEDELERNPEGKYTEQMIKGIQLQARKIQELENSL